jgi:hypothetical protein
MRNLGSTPHLKNQTCVKRFKAFIAQNVDLYVSVSAFGKKLRDHLVDIIPVVGILLSGDFSLLSVATVDAVALFRVVINFF